MSSDVESRLYRAESWIKRATESSHHLDGQLIFHWIALNALYGQRGSESATAVSLMQGLASLKSDAALLLESEFLYEEYWVAGRNWGRHFWSNVSDSLRVGLFGVLDEFLGSQLITLNSRGKAGADEAFREHNLFFVHACKVRPLPAELKAPPGNVIASWARDCAPLMPDGRPLTQATMSVMKELRPRSRDAFPARTR